MVKTARLQWLAWDFSVPLVGHVLSADAAILPQNPGVGAHIP